MTGDQSGVSARTPEEALAAIAALHKAHYVESGDDFDRYFEVQEILASVQPAQRGTAGWDDLVALLAEALGQHRLDASVAVGSLADRVLALVRPIDGIVLTRDEADTARRIVSVYAQVFPDDRRLQDLAARLEAAS